MSDGADAAPHPPYRLDELGWLQFERVCSLILEAQFGVAAPAFSGHADGLRRAVLTGPVALPSGVARHDGPVEVLVAWVAAEGSARSRMEVLRERLAEVDGRPIMLLSNLELPDAFAGEPGIVVFGAREIGEALDRHPQVRVAVPSVLGSRELSDLLSPRVRRRSSLDLEGAAALARVFWPTRAHARAWDVLARHRFVVLTGPPEMGKTAIAQMLALALMTAGWEAHECRSPEQLWRRFERHSSPGVRRR